MESYINEEKIDAVHYTGKEKQELCQFLLIKGFDFNIEEGKLKSINGSAVLTGYTYFTSTKINGLMSIDTKLFKNRYTKEDRPKQG